MCRGNKKISNTLGGKHKEFSWYIEMDLLVVEKQFKSDKVKREIKFTKKELIDTINFINTEKVVTLSNDVIRMGNITEEQYIYDNYFKKGLGPFICKISDKKKELIYKAQATSQLVAILVDEEILEYRNKRSMEFYLKFNKNKAIEDLENMFKKVIDTKVSKKLVRDKIPAIIESDGKICDVEIATKEEIRKLLEDKLMEEVNEYLEDKNLEELADVMEVLFGLAESLGYREEDLVRKRNEKLEERGGFKKGIVFKGVK